MNPHASNERPVTDERLSAYFDGEASPDERVAIESLLDDSLTARRELDEIAQLSALLHSFPRESAPTELVADVQRQTDQMPLATQTVSPAIPARSLRREWTAAISGAVVTAAALLMMASVVDKIGSHELNTVTQTDRSVPAVAERAAVPSPASAVVSVFGGAGGAPRYAEGVTDGTVTRPLAVEAASNSMAPAAAKVSAANAGTDALFETRQNSALGANLVVLDNGGAQNFHVNNPDFLNGLKVGEIYQFVPQVADNGSNVAVVDLAVLDVERGVDQVQVLLSRNSIQPRLVGQSNDLEKQKAQKLGDQSKSGGHEMVVVYTVGPGEQLAKTLEDMQQHPDLFFGWSSQPPVQLPSDDELAAARENATSVKGATVLAEKSIADKSGAAKSNADRQLAARRKEAAAANDTMDDEAELALNALLVRNTYANSGALNYGIANFNDSNTVNLGAKHSTRGVAGDGKPSSRAGAPEPPGPAPAGAPITAAAQPAKTLSTDPKNAPPPAASSRTVADEKGKGDSTAKKSGGQNQDANARREPGLRSSYQTTFRVPTDAAPLAGQVPQLNRSATLGLDNAASRVRRNSGNGMLQQAESNSRTTANAQTDANRVKVLFVLRPMPAPTAAPVGKPNP